MSLEFAEGVVEIYRKEWAPLVPKLWYGLQQAATDAVWTGEEQEDHGILYRMEDRWLVAEILNGSTIAYYDPQPATSTRIKRPGGKWQAWQGQDLQELEAAGWEIWNTKGFTYRVEKQGHLVTRHAFGGQLTENIVMKIERELVEQAKRKLEDNGFPVIMEVHDEIVCEPTTTDIDSFKQIMEDVPRWVRDMQIPVHVDVWMGERYKK
jgi:DNA polymerase